MTESGTTHELECQSNTTQQSKRYRWLAPPRIVFNLWAALLFLASLWVWRVPGGEWPLAWWLMLFWFVTAVVWLAKVIFHQLFSAQAESRTRQRAWQPFILGLITLMVVGILDLPATMGFAISKPALESIVQSGDASYTGWAGVYRVEMQRTGDGVWMFQTSSGNRLAGAGGVAYIPHNFPREWLARTQRVQSLGNGWYAYRLRP